MALGIAATTTMVSVAYSVLVRPLPCPIQRAAFTEAPIEVFTSYRPDLTEGDPWLLGRGRVLVISVTRGSGSGTVFEAPDGTRFIFRAVATREEADAAAANAGADARVFAARPAWSTHARAWVDADPQLWRVPQCCLVDEQCSTSWIFRQSHAAR
jgi:hypothetical protein